MTTTQTMGSDDFVAAVCAAADLGVGHLVTRTRNTLGGERYDTATITFYNVSETEGRRGGGAVAMNNRLQFFVEGFGRGQNEAASGKVKLTFGGCEGWPRESKRPKGKTATPAKVAAYVASLISVLAATAPKL